VIETFRGAPIEELVAVLGGAALHRVRVPEPAALVRGVVIHTPGDPPPDPDLLALCTAPETGVPSCVGVVIRESQVTEALAATPPGAAVFAAPDNARWSDVYDRVQWALRDSFGQLAVHDAFQLADALAVELGGAVAIEDAGRRVVAFSTVAGQPIDDVRRQGILDRHVPEHVERERWYAQMWRGTGVAEFAGGTESTARLAVAVRAGAETLGSIWVIGTRETLNPGADEILQRSAGVVAACLAHQDHFASRGRETRGQILRQLLGGPVAAGQALGYALPGPTVLVAFSRGEQPGGDLELLDARLSDVLSLHAQRLQGFGLAAVIDGRVYALLPASERIRLDAQLRGVVSRLAFATGLVAVGPTVERLDELPRARRQVDRLLALCGRRGPGRGDIIHVPDERDNLVLAEMADAARDVEALQAGVISKIAGYDRDHGTAYVPTLRAWFEAGGDVATAAARLHVHANTFRYRIARTSTLFGLRLDQPDERLLLHLQLRLADFA
jgi:hypothetical protein